MSQFNCVYIAKAMRGQKEFVLFSTAAKSKNGCIKKVNTLLGQYRIATKRKIQPPKIKIEKINL